MRRAVLALCAVAGIALLCALYLSNLSAMGLVSTDEPRYADIGRAMARTCDWVTPHLWGHPWFEKPALLYWMIAVGFKAGLGPELAPRLPVALMGSFFLLFYWFRLKALWDARTASYSTAILATSVGWLGYSHAAITDIPVSVLFSAAVLLAITKDGEAPRRTLIAAMLGLATLAKSLFPLVLFVPVIALDYRQIRAWLRPAPVLMFAAVSLPWHVLCFARNGNEFLKVLFVEHQFGRFTSGAIQHGQRWWFYIPVLLLLLYPWFPLLIVATRERRDPRTRVLLAVVVFGFLFISASVNKLPGYLLPLLPSICALIGVGLAKTKRASPLLAACMLLLGLLRPAASVLPTALASGLRASTVPWSRFPLWMGAGLLAGILIAIVFRKNSVLAAAGFTAVCLLCFQISVFPDIDRAASARPRWLAEHPQCQPDVRRAVEYGMNYYAERELPRCSPAMRYP
jgi:4-amino-4-deoxy-L-arabinose transferase-like glycosyltransferase